MGSISTFNSRVAARTRAAEHILVSPELLALYEDSGGLRGDLEEIRDLGRRAEVASQARSGVKADSGSATQAALDGFAALQRDYAAVMAVVQACQRDLAKQGAAAHTLGLLDGILRDQTAVRMRVETIETIEAGETGEAGKTRRRAVRRRSHEAVRAEINRDVAQLLALKDVHDALGKRKVTLARLTKLRDDAAALSRQLGEKLSKRGAGKAATTAVRDAVREQKQAWGACYRILARVAQQDERVRQLLSEAARKR